MAIALSTNHHLQYRCVASLIGHCEAAIASGHLTAPATASMQLLVDETLAAFGLSADNQRMLRERATS